MTFKEGESEYYDYEVEIVKYDNKIFKIIKRREYKIGKIGQNHDEIIHCIANNPKNDNFKFWISEGIEYFNEGKEELISELTKIIGNCMVTVDTVSSKIFIKKI